MLLKLNDTYVKPFVTEKECAYMQSLINEAHTLLHERSGQGNSFLGWLDLPRDYDSEEHARIRLAANSFGAV